MKRLIQRSARLLVGVTLVVVLGYLLIPIAVRQAARWYADRWMETPTESGQKKRIRFFIDRLDWNNVTVRDIEVGPGNEPALQIGRLSADYVLEELVRHHIRSVTVSDSSVFLISTGNTVRLRSQEALEAFREQERGTDEPARFPRVTVENFALERARALFMTGQSIETVLVDAEARVESREEDIETVGIAHVQGYGLSGRFKFSAAHNYRSSTGRLTSEGMELRLGDNAAALLDVRDIDMAVETTNAGTARLSGELTFGLRQWPKGGLRVELNAETAADGRVEGVVGATSLWSDELKIGGARIGSIRWNQPFSWAPDGTTSTAAPGNLEIQSIELQPWVQFRYSSVSRQKDASLELDGECVFGDRTSLPVSARLGLIDIDGAIKWGARMETRFTPENGDLSALVPQGRALAFRGQVAALLYIDDSIPRFRVKGTFDTIEDKETALLLSGVRVVCEGTLAPDFRSHPAQTLFIESLSTGNLRLTDIGARYQIEPRGVFFLEEGRFSWCGGRVDIQPIRWSASSDELTIRLYCSHIEVDQALSQIGFNVAHGEGTLNGHIPLTLRRGRLSIEDGFLYTKPGVGGHIAFSGLDALASSMPSGSPQAGQMALAVDALKAFDYEWLTLNFKTFGDELTIALRVFGKPARPLPYRYVKETGAYMRIEGKGTAELMRPMRFDLNFNVPLNKLIHSGIKIAELLEF